MQRAAVALRGDVGDRGAAAAAITAAIGPSVRRVHVHAVAEERCDARRTRRRRPRACGPSDVRRAHTGEPRAIVSSGKVPKRIAVRPLSMYCSAQ